MHLAARGHNVAGFDNLDRRKNVEEVGSISATPIRSMDDRQAAFRRDRHHDQDIGMIRFQYGDVTDYDYLSKFVKSFKPDTIVHLGEQPSAPFSMKDQKHAVYTQHNNVIGTLNVIFAIREHVPDCALVKIGTMGEYGTPNIEIAENPIELEFKGRKEIIQFPKNAGSWYHQSKVHDTNNILFANKVYGLRATDIMQGVVYGTRTDEMTHDDLLTRFDVDSDFGTAVNRFTAQAVIGHPLTPYGKGGQTRGYLALIDSVQCLTLAIENPPEKGEYRLFNQLAQTYSVNELAQIVKDVAYESYGIDIPIRSVDNPRVEKEEHFYQVEAQKLRKLGFRETRSIRAEVNIMLKDMIRFKDRILLCKGVMMPVSYWNKERLEAVSPPSSS